VHRILLVCALLLAPAIPAHAGWIAEFEHPKVVIQFHPAAKDLFKLEDIDQALKDGVSAVELDVRLRERDGAVVCSHSAKNLAERPTMEQAIQRILDFKGANRTVHADHHQFFIVLDFKERSPALLDGAMAVLREHVDQWSTSVGPNGTPRPITVIASGERMALAARIRPVTLDSLCVLEGTDYRGRIRSLTGIPFQWISLPHPSERGRIRALHGGTDLAAHGTFNVRAFDCRGKIRECLAAGADAINADRDEIKGARALLAVEPERR